MIFFLSKVKQTTKYKNYLRSLNSFYFFFFKRINTECKKKYKLLNKKEAIKKYIKNNNKLMQ